MYKSFIYRLYTNNKQSKKLLSLLNTARSFYNTSLQERKDSYNMLGISLNYYDQNSKLKALRHNNPELAQINYSANQDILRRLDKTFRAFFRRVKNKDKAGFPRFKGHNRFNSITFPTYGDGVKIKDNKLYIQNVGLVKIKIHRPLDGIIKTVAIKRECDKWYAVFSNTLDIEPLPYSDKEVGIDVGIESFAITSDNEFIGNPHYLKKNMAKLRIVQRSVSRKQKGGHNRNKAINLLVKLHSKIKNQRKDFIHKVTDKIVKSYGYIAAEDLRISSMVKDHNFAQSINDVSWGQFITALSYKAEYAGRVFVKVNPKGTTQTCSACGTTVTKDLSVRIHNCHHCGISLHRDLNSAFNILALGRSVWGLTYGNSQSVPQEAIYFG